MKPLELEHLGQCNGTTKYYRLPLCKSVVTDGIHYIMESGYSWLVTDSLILIDSEYSEEEFLVVKLKLKKSVGTVTIEDGNGNKFHTQIYSYTDAKRELTLYWQNKVLMLSNEY